MTSVPDFIETAARLHGGTVALRFGGHTWTYGQLAHGVARAASYLAAVHVRGRLGILSASRPGVVIACHASARTGTSFVPHGWRLTFDELVWQVASAGVTTLLYDELRTDLARQLGEQLNLGLIPVANLEPGPHAIGEAAPGAATIDLEREAAILFTSGTTGRPKGACITYGNLWFSAIGSSLLLGHRPGDMWVAALSLHHIGGLSILYRAAIGGATVDLHERFEPEKIVTAIKDGASYISLVPVMLQRVIEAMGDEFIVPESLCGILLGGAAAPRPLVEECLRRGLPVLPTYGLTETSSQAATLRVGDVPAHLGSSGQALPLTELRVMAHGAPVEPGDLGEIEVRGPSVFAGYLGDPPRRPECWFATGDAGYLDENGYLFVVDRRRDLIVSGGENIYPAEVERVLLAHPLVKDAAVVGIADETWGARPVATVVWAGAAGRAAAALQDHCQLSLATFKVPDRFLEVEEIPRSPAGKLLRRRVRELVEDG